LIQNTLKPVSSDYKSFVTRVFVTSVLILIKKPFDS